MPKVRTGSRWIREKQAWVKRMYTCGYMYIFIYTYLPVFVHACIYYIHYILNFHSFREEEQD